MRKVLSSASILLVAMLVIIGPAGAHEGPGAIEVLGADVADDLTVRYRIRVTFVDDGHGAPEATVTATVLDAGRARTPVPFARGAEEGIYEGEVTYPSPGSWTVRFTSIRPTASIERPEELAAPVTTATPSAPTSAPSPEGTAQETDDEATGGGGTPLVVAGAAGIIGALAAVLLVRRRRRETDSEVADGRRGP